MNLHHLPTLTEVIDEASFAPRAPAFEVSPGMVDLSDAPALPPASFRTPTPQDVDRLRGDDTPFEATVSDHAIRRALAGHEARMPEVSLADAPEPPAFVPTEPPAPTTASPEVDDLLEQRLREALAPLLAEAADVLAARAGEVLASSLRDLVAEAVAREFERQRGR